MWKGAAGTRVHAATSTVLGTTGQLLGTHLEEDRPNRKFKSLLRLITSEKRPPPSPPRQIQEPSFQWGVAGTRAWGDPEHRSLLASPSAFLIVILVFFFWWQRAFIEHLLLCLPAPEDM